MRSTYDGNGEGGGLRISPLNWVPRLRYEIVKAARDKIDANNETIIAYQAKEIERQKAVIKTQDELICYLRETVDLLHKMRGDFQNGQE